MPSSKLYVAGFIGIRININIIMKAIFVSYNQALTERVMFILDKCLARGYTKWDTVHGRGSIDGDPRLGSHAWPELNSAILTIVDDDRVEAIVKSFRMLNENTPEQGLRVFTWSVDNAV